MKIRTSRKKTSKRLKNKQTFHQTLLILDANLETSCLQIVFLLRKRFFSYNRLGRWDLVDKENASKVEEEKKDGTAPAESEELLSLDSLDSIIAHEDPEFAKSLDDIGPDITIEIYNEGLSLEYTQQDEEKIVERIRIF